MFTPPPEPGQKPRPAPPSRPPPPPLREAVFDDMPALVDGNRGPPGGFFAPPPGATSGGQPGVYEPFGGGGAANPWPASPGGAGLPSAQWNSAYSTGYGLSSTPTQPGSAPPGYPPFASTTQPSGYPPHPMNAIPIPSWTFSAPVPAGGYAPFNAASATPALTWGGSPLGGGYTPFTPFGGGSLGPSGYPMGGGAAAATTPDGVSAGGFFGAPTAATTAAGQHGGGGGNVAEWLGLGGQATTAAAGGGGVQWGAPLGPAPSPNTAKENRKRERANSMKRTISADPTRTPNSKSQPTTPMHRSVSLGHSPFGQPSPGAYPAFSPGGAWAPVPPGFGGYPPHFAYFQQQQQLETPGPANLAKRPRDWRPDYAPKGGLSNYIPGILNKGRSDVKEYSDPQRRNLIPLLLHKPGKPPLVHDLRDNPFTNQHLFRSQSTRINLSATPTTRPSNSIDFAQIATNPECTMMRLYHASLPWFVDVRQSHPNGITVHDILVALWTQLLSPITGRHYWNEEMTDEDRNAVNRAFSERCTREVAKPDGDARTWERGVCQVDFLGRRTVFVGLVRGKNGNWEMKLEKVGEARF